jgi:hypothetical protein
VFGRTENEILREIRDELAAIRRLIEHFLRHQAHSATLNFRTIQGETTMPLTVHLSDKPGTAVFQEWTGATPGTGVKVNPIGPVGFVSDTPSVATVDPSGQLTYLSAGSAVISAKDSGNGLSAQDTLTVVADVAQSASLALQAGQ